jgi:hypothetical protein
MSARSSALVAGRMAEAVVDRLQAVEVHHEQRAPGAMAAPARDVLGDGPVDAARGFFSVAARG